MRKSFITGIALALALALALVTSAHAANPPRFEDFAVTPETIDQPAPAHITGADRHFRTVYR